jgi:hypothetical protein
MLMIVEAGSVRASSTIGEYKMFHIELLRNSRRVAVLLLAAVFVGPISIVAQEAEKPAYDAYKGVTIGMSMTEARDKLGSPRDKSDSQDLYVFSDDETAQVYYDAATKTVSAITVTFTGKLDKVPGPKAVFGIDAEAKPDGGIFKMVRYPEAGFWVSYNKIVGDDPIIIIAIKKI